MLAQQMLHEDRDVAMFRLGISEEIAEMLDSLTPGQILKMAGANLLLCRFRFDDRLLLGLLSSHDRDAGTARMHATILAADKPVEAIV
jgi:flagellar transcriptional activator FlhD